MIAKNKETLSIALVQTQTKSFREIICIQSQRLRSRSCKFKAYTPFFIKGELTGAYVLCEIMLNQFYE